MQVSLSGTRQIAPLAHFDLLNEKAYAAWRQRKLLNYPRSSMELLVGINDFMALTADEHAAILIARKI